MYQLNNILTHICTVPLLVVIRILQKDILQTRPFMTSNNSRLVTRLFKLSRSYLYKPLSIYVTHDGSL